MCSAAPRIAVDPGIARLVAVASTDTTATCRNCGHVIVYRPYFLDGGEPNPPVWWHPPGAFTCPIPAKPEDAAVWPVAEPAGVGRVWPVDVTVGGHVTRLHVEADTPDEAEAEAAGLLAEDGAVWAACTRIEAHEPVLPTTRTTPMTDSYPPMPLLDHATAIADERGMPAPDGLGWSLRAVKPDLTSRKGYRWPFPGEWAAPEPTGDHQFDTANTGGCPTRPGDGLCVARTWRGMAQGRHTAGTLLLVGWRPDDVLGGDSDKLRAKRVYVRDVIDGFGLVRRHGARADLTGADLTGAYLTGANLTGANLTGAYLTGAYLTGAEGVQR